MADAGTAAPGPSHGAAAGGTFQLEVRTLAGGCLAAIPDAQGSWQLADVLGRLPEVLPGHKCQLLRGEAVLAAGMAIAEWAQPVDGRACATAVVAVVPTQEEQRQLDLALIEAAGELDAERVRELLLSGADARSEWAFAKKKTALHAAIEAESKGEEEEEEDERRLQAVVGALLAARADVNAQRKIEAAAFISRAAALHAAVRRGSLGAARLLLDANASVDAVARQRRRGYGDQPLLECTALHLATQAGSLPLAKLLLERAADVNAVRREEELGREGEDEARLVPVRETALHLAVAGGHQVLVALLMQARADAGIARSRGGKDTSLEELCAGKPGMLDALQPDFAAALLEGGAFGTEVEAALTAVAARRPAA